MPPTPASYAGCLIDPAGSDPFELLDPSTAIPIIDNNGIASLATTVIDNLDPFIFSRPMNSPQGVYDLLLQHNGQTLYFAVFASGKVGFTTSSSNGQIYVPQGGDKFITTVFSVDCSGFITAGIVGGSEFKFVVENNNVMVENAPQLRMKPRDIPVPSGFYVLPKAAPPSPPSSSRCPDPSQTAVLKSPPPAPSANGCGTDKGIGSFVPNLNFVECCNGHDFCYGKPDLIHFEIIISMDT